MSVRPLASEQLARLRAAPLTYQEVGATTGELPAGYHRMRRQAPIGSGRDFFERAATELFGWQLHTRAGFAVAASSAVVEADGVAILRLRLGPLLFRAPVRVVDVEESEDYRGFRYGTLPGHPERGEESFRVELRADQSVVVMITAFSQPATLLTRLGGPVARRVQESVTDRYLRALC